MRGGPGAEGETTQQVTGPASDDRAMIDRSLDHKCPRCQCHFFFEGQVYTIPTTCTTVSRAHGADVQSLLCMSRLTFYHLIS